MLSAPTASSLRAGQWEPLRHKPILSHETDAGVLGNAQVEDLLEYYMQRAATLQSESERLLAGARDLEESIGVSLSARRFEAHPAPFAPSPSACYTHRRNVTDSRLRLTLSACSFKAQAAIVVYPGKTTNGSQPRFCVSGASQSATLVLLSAFLRLVHATADTLG